MSGRLTIDVTVSEKCNKNCSYCFEKNKTAPNKYKADQLRLVTKCCEDFDLAEYPDGLDISFWGGEPFVDSSFMKEIVDATRRYEFVRYHVYTNGTLTDEIVRFSEYLNGISLASRFCFQFSYDGSPHHENKRGYSPDAVLESARAAAKYGFGTTFKATLSYDMIRFLPEIWDSYKTLYDEFGDSVWYCPTLDVTSCDEASLAEWRAVLPKIAARELDFHSANGRCLSTWFGRPFKPSCRIGSYFNLHSDGNAYICHGCPYAENGRRMALGRLSDASSALDFAKKIELPPNPRCEECCAEYCSVCHAMNMPDVSGPDEAISKWTAVRDADKPRCKYYKCLGLAVKAFRLELYRRISDGLQRFPG